MDDFYRIIKFNPFCDDQVLFKNALNLYCEDVNDKIPKSTQLTKNKLNDE